VLGRRTLGVVVVEEAATDAPDHQGVPPHQLRKRRLLVPICKPFQQLAIQDLLGRRRGGQLADMSEHGTEWWASHGLDFPKALSLLYNCRWRAKWYDFWGKGARLRVPVPPAAIQKNLSRLVSREYL
jgi:hypothetical protein